MSPSPPGMFIGAVYVSLIPEGGLWSMARSGRTRGDTGHGGVKLEEI